VSPTSLIATQNRQGLSGRHVLIGFLVFFGIIFLVNGTLIYAALSTHTGVVANEPYRKGLAYNQRIAADERQARLGWNETLELSQNGRVTLLLMESDGRAVKGLKIKGILGRPATNRQDIKLALAETSPGHYEAQTFPMAQGSWLITVEARLDGNVEPIYRTRRRLWLKP
jgi:nitrogen fixation protein FixH